jgi:DNA repair protein RecO (recombination protein O)
VKAIKELKGGTPVSGKDFRKIHESTRYAMQYIVSTPVEKLFRFQVSEEVLAQLQKIMKEYMHVYVKHTFKSLQIIDELELK